MPGCYGHPGSAPGVIPANITFVIRTIRGKGICSGIVIAPNYIPDLRCGVRFPIRLAITIHHNGQEFPAESQNISSAGALFLLDHFIPVDSTIEFVMAMPAGNFRTGKDVLVNCTGRVVRCSPVGNRQELAVIIDEYRFLRS